MKKVTYYCDKCKQALDASLRISIDGKYDLCEDCAEELQEHIERFFEDSEDSGDDA